MAGDGEEVLQEAIARQIQVKACRMCRSCHWGLAANLWHAASI